MGVSEKSIAQKGYPRKKEVEGVLGRGDEEVGEEDRREGVGGIGVGEIDFDHLLVLSMNLLHPPIVDFVVSYRKTAGFVVPIVL